MTGEALLPLFHALDEHGVEYVVVGALAINLLGLPRATVDADLFVRPTEENVERLRRAMRAVWDDPELETLSADELAGEYAVVRYGLPEGSEVQYVDLIGHLGEAFHFKDLRTQVVEVAGVPIRVATPATLIQMKRDTLRPQDQVDAARLRERFPELAEER